MAAEHLLPGPPPNLADFRLEAGGTECACGSSEPSGSRGPRMWMIFSGKQISNPTAK
uniref:Calmodulin like 4 n=1 Tax=Piliocolobus tephrosceles TaxID=591936 RepID=A0A8C9IAS9_9PRIM